MRGASNPTEGLLQKAADVLGTALKDLGAALGERAAAKLTDRVGRLTDSLTDFAKGGTSARHVAMAAGLTGLAQGQSPVRAAIGAAVAGGKSKLQQAFGKGPRMVNIVESIDVGVPLRVAYDQWTRFADFPSYTKKVEDVAQESDEKLIWRAQIFLSKRTWEATILEQVPDEHIIWRSKGAKGWVDGAVSFHELAPSLTRILVVLEYHPQGLFEKTGNIWRAQGRRARLELKHFARHMMTRTLAERDRIEGWRGEIRDGQVVRDHESAVQEEESDVHSGGRDNDGGNGIR